MSNVPVSSTTRSKSGDLRTEKEKSTQFLNVESPPDSKKRGPKRGEVVTNPEVISPGFIQYRDREPITDRVIFVKPDPEIGRAHV